MKKIMLICTILASLNAISKEEWFCTDDQAIVKDNVWAICGIGTMGHEGPAREFALNNAVHEFKVMCEMSENCKGKKVRVEPKRSTCFREKDYNGYTCHRLFIFTVEE
jgi:hypothetical protein